MTCLWGGETCTYEDTLPSLGDAPQDISWAEPVQLINWINAYQMDQCWNQACGLIFSLFSSFFTSFFLPYFLKFMSLIYLFISPHPFIQNSLLCA